MVKNHHTGSDELVRERERRRRSSRRDVQLGEKVLNMPGDRVIADEQLVCDLMVGFARGDQPQHLEFPVRQPVRIGVTASLNGDKSNQR